MCSRSRYLVSDFFLYLRRNILTHCRHYIHCYMHVLNNTWTECYSTRRLTTLDECTEYQRTHARTKRTNVPTQAHRTLVRRCADDDVSVFRVQLSGGTHKHTHTSTDTTRFFMANEVANFSRTFTYAQWIRARRSTHANIVGKSGCLLQIGSYTLRLIRSTVPIFGFGNKHGFIIVYVHYVYIDIGMAIDR